MGSSNQQRLGVIKEQGSDTPKTAIQDCSEDDMAESRIVRVESADATTERKVEYPNLQRADFPAPKGKEGKATVKQLRQILEAQNYRCATCRIELTPDMAQIDHKQPVSDGGDDRASNLQWLCRECNKAKGSMPLGSFIAMCKRIAKHFP